MYFSVFGGGATQTIQTKYGKLEGAEFYIDDFNWPGYKFLNVPFAAPPTGPLRFKPPQPVSSWDGVRKATEHGRVALLFSRWG